MRGPRAESAHYDARRNRVIIRLTTGVEIGFALGDVKGLQRVSTADLRLIEVEAFGLGIHFPAINADLHVPAFRATSRRAGGDQARRMITLSPRPVIARSRLATRQSATARTVDQIAASPNGSSQ
jgi:hypothetical protein